MPKLIKDAVLIDNPWLLVAKDSSLGQTLENTGAHLLVPLQLWLENKAILLESDKQIAVWLDSDENAEMIADDLNQLTLVALNFPTFMDGRAYSTAGIIRQQYQFKGELRAIGNVLRDQLSYMTRCGFDSFDVSDEVKIEDALAGFTDFKDNYQSNINQPEPLFRRR